MRVRVVILLGAIVSLAACPFGGPEEDPDAGLPGENADDGGASDDAGPGDGGSHDGGEGDGGVADGGSSGDAGTSHDGGTSQDGGTSSDGGTCDASGEGYWPAASAEFECEVLRLVNQRRAAGGTCGTRGTFAPSAPLTMQPQLRRAARLHSEDMGLRNYFSHDSPGGPNGDTLAERVTSAGFTGWSLLGENIGGGWISPQDVMTVWMNSSGHCANILNPNYNLLGVGYANVPGSQMTHYWTQVFAKR